MSSWSFILVALLVVCLKALLCLKPKAYTAPYFHSVQQTDPLKMIRHDICQQIYATAVFGPKKLRKKSINRDKIKSATKQRKCPKMAILQHLGVEMDN